MSSSIARIFIRESTKCAKTFGIGMLLTMRSKLVIIYSLCQYFPHYKCIHKNWHHISHLIILLSHCEQQHFNITNANWFTFQHSNIMWNGILLNWRACNWGNQLNSFLQCRLPKSALVPTCTVHGIYSVYSSTFVTLLDFKCELYPTNIDIKVELLNFFFL